MKTPRFNMRMIVINNALLISLLIGLAIGVEEVYEKTYSLRGRKMRIGRIWAIMASLVICSFLPH